LDQQGFQEVRTGRGSVLIEYEPAGPHGKPIHEGVRSESGYCFSQTYATRTKQLAVGNHPLFIWVKGEIWARFKQN